jgi:low temperature requirement protein LtrA
VVRAALGLRPRDPHETHRVASPLELFTDLCYVVAIAQSAAQLHHAISENHVVHGLTYFGISFFAIWWAWLNFAWFNSAYDPDDVLHRLLTLLQIFGSLVLAAGIPRMFHGDFTLGVAGYVVMRIGLVVMWARAAQGHPDRRSTAIRYVVGLLAIQGAWVAALLLGHGHIAVVVFVVLAICDVLVPVFAESAGSTPWHPHHISERYGLMFIIVLGETILSVTIALQGAFDSEHPPMSLWLVVVGGVLATFSMWWLYFAREASDALSGSSGSGDYLWGFGHYFVYGSVAATGAGLAARVDLQTHHSEASDLLSAAAITVPAAVFVLALWTVSVRRHDRSLGVASLFVFAAMILVALTWAPAAEAWVGLVLVALLLKESRHRRAASPSVGTAH